MSVATTTELSARVKLWRVSDCRCSTCRGNLRALNVALKQDANSLLYNGVDAGLGVLIDLV